MVTTASTYTNPRYRAAPGDGYDGVVRVSVAGYYGTGVLLYDGHAVLTAAHLFEQGDATATVHFATTQGRRDVEAAFISVMPGYDPVNLNGDIALVWLAESAPVDAERYDLYRTPDAVGAAFTFVGYGVPGGGTEGALASYSEPPLRLQAQNRFDAEGSVVAAALAGMIDWSPAPETQLVADFDNGSAARDALGGFLERVDLGMGAAEGMISHGDSGGPAFIGGRVAALASYVAHFDQGGFDPDINSKLDSSFGETGFWQRTGFYQEWVDRSVRAQYPDAPTRPEEVEHIVREGDAGTEYAYFLLQFTGMREDPAAWLSVDYVTRDGTARAGQDYISVSGTLVLYPNENSAVIPVEIVGDTIQEQNEFFYLDVFNPVGADFGTGVVKLTAVRTIVDDDGAWV